MNCSFAITVTTQPPVLDTPNVIVSTSGSDTTGLGTIDRPFRTINQGLSVSGAGVTCYVRGLPTAAGVYDEGVETTCPSGTSWTNKFRLAAYPNETVWMTPSVPFVNNPGQVFRLYSGEHYIEIDGINMDGQAMAYGVFAAFFYDAAGETHHIRLKNCELIARTGPRLSEWAGLCVDLGAHTVIGAQGGFEIQHCILHGGGANDCAGADNRCSAYGAYLATPNSLVEYCDIYDTSSAGVHIYNGGGDPANNNTVRFNRIHDIVRTGNDGQVWGVLVFGDGNQVYGNQLYRITAGLNAHGNAAVAVYQSANTKVWQNTAYGNISDAVYVDGAATNCEVRNNISRSNGTDALVNFGSGTTADHNLEGVDPRFVDPAAANFHLQAGSPALGAGVFIPPIASPFGWKVNQDVDGVVRGNPPTIGAYEH